MAFLINKQEKEIQNQIKVLATNLEILNQKLNRDPDSIISPGEKAIKDSVNDMTKELTYIKNVLKSTQLDVMNTFKNEKEAISVNVAKMDSVIKNLGKFDKAYLNEMMTHIEHFNRTAEKLNVNLEKYQKNMTHILDTQSAQITKKIYFKLFKSLKKDNLVMMGFTSLLSSAVALIVLMALLLIIK
jgi:2-succinyl-5-enolpyruvyl-6-hydroxy-3-cyclohexene-1-carboxylate synthase